VNINFICCPRAKKAFTLVETLLAVTILMMVFNIFYFYMQSQNRQILTLVQKNEVEEVANFAMQYLANDIKSARRGSVVITPSSLTLDRFIEEEKDAKQSAQLAMMKVEYLYDSSKQQLTRNASKYDPSSYDDSTGVFKTQPKLAETKIFNKISAFELTKINMPPISGISDMAKHMLGVDVKICAEAANALTHVSQKSYKEDKVYIRDEIAFKNQPFWNQNPKYTKVGPIALKFTDPLTINLSQLEFLNWINSLKKASNVKLAFEDINNNLMTALSNEALSRVNSLYPSLMSQLDGEVKRQTQDIYASKIAQDYSGAKDKIAAALLLKDYILTKSPADCKALKSRIASGFLEETEIKNYVKSNAENLKKYGILSAADVSAIDDATSSVEVISRVSRLISASAPETPKLIFKFVETLSLAFANKIKKQICDSINVKAYVQKKIGELVDPAIDQLLNILGVKAMIDEIGKSELGEPAKIAVQSAVNSFKSWLKDQITQKLSEFTNKLLDTVTKTVTEGASGGQTREEIERQQRERSIGDDIGGAINDIFSAVIITVSKNLLLGNKYDEAGKSFIASSAKDYLNSSFKDFEYDISSVLDADQRDALKNDEQIRRVEQIINGNK